MELPASVVANDVLETAFVLVETLTAVYRWIADQQLGEEATSLFSSLLKIEESHLIELKKIRAVDYL